MLVFALQHLELASHELALELQWHRARPLGQAGRWLKEALLARVPR